MSATVLTTDPQFRQALQSCAEALRTVARIELPEALQRQMQELGERKEFLDEHSHEQLMALVALSQERTVEKLQAEVALQQLHRLFPDEIAA